MAAGVVTAGVPMVAEVMARLAMVAAPAVMVAAVPAVMVAVPAVMVAVAVMARDLRSLHQLLLALLVQRHLSHRLPARVALAALVW